MGTKVYEAGNGGPGGYLFAHDTKGQPGGITLLVINTNKDSTSLNIPSHAEQYTLTSKELQGTAVMLNGKELQLDANDELPEIKGNAVKQGNVVLPATSISFFTFVDAGNNSKK
jgi:hypothetical protein